MLAAKNRYTYLRRDLSARLLRMYVRDEIMDFIDGLPVSMVPREKESLRCCIYRDRAMLRSRILTLLGVDLERDDEVKSLSSYAAEVLRKRHIPDEPVLTMIREACSACTPSHYRVSGACQGCLARPCQENCPRSAIRMVNGRAEIDTQACIGCGKCLNVCPFQAIQYIPVPCEEACPVGAIKKDESGRASIDQDRCISCGHCSRACPFGAVVERSQIMQVARLLKESFGAQGTPLKEYLLKEQVLEKQDLGEKDEPGMLKQTHQPIIALLAPSFVSQFPGSPEQVIEALHILGFTAVFEVAEGAADTAQLESDEVLERTREGTGVKFITTSCCPAYAEAVVKHLPELQPHISHTPSPMELISRKVAQKYPDACQVFIGPCIAKRKEAMGSQHVDYVLTFEELGTFFMAWDIELDSLVGRAADTISRSQAAKMQSGSINRETAAKNLSDQQEVMDQKKALDQKKIGRGFAETGGVAAAVSHFWKGAEVLKAETINGMHSSSIRKMKKLKRSLANGTKLVEVMACEGGCSGGPGCISMKKPRKPKLFPNEARGAEA
ncbi:MAG: 4Fe-4S binding protein [Spirochaetia bacterium]|nr:4Fe-4S binding protein [Spirochaetia bacterium]